MRASAGTLQQPGYTLADFGAACAPFDSVET